MQKEKPGVTRSEMGGIIGRPLTEQDLLSGGQIESFQEGWAKQGFSGSKTSHYFKRKGFDKAVALCGHEADVRWLYGAGNYPNCKNCASKRQNQTRYRGQYA